MFENGIKMDFNQAMTLCAVVATNLITVITLFCHMDNKTQSLIMAFREETSTNLKAIQDEMKDFHGRLCAIEERNKK